MSVTLHCIALGVPVAVTVTGSYPDNAVEEFDEAWGWCQAAYVKADPDQLPIELDWNIPSPEHWHPAMDSITGAITRAAIERRKHDLFMLHACAVVVPGFGVVGLIGPSGQGKTTAATALGQRFPYLTDETLALTVEGRVVPYPKPLSTLRPNQAFKSQLSPAGLGLQPPQTDAPLRALYVFGREPGIDRPQVRPVELTEVLDVVVPQISYLDARTEPLQTLVAILDRCGGLREVKYSEADTLPDWLERVAASSETLRIESTPLWVDSLERSTVSNLPDKHYYLRTTGHDALRSSDQRLVVMRDRQVLVLDGIAPALWEALERPRRLEELTEIAVDTYGSPADIDPKAAVRQALDELANNGLVQTPREV